MTAFTATPARPYAREAVAFTDRTAGSPSTWAWWFGDEDYASALWTLETAAPGWQGRWGHGLVALSDGSLVAVAGNLGTRTFINDVWASADGGATWTEQTAWAAFASRTYAAVVAMQDDSILLIGGMDRYLYRDVWRSADAGANWTQQSTYFTKTARRGHAAAVLPDGSVVVTGGFAGVVSGIALGDATRSADLGVTWTPMTGAAEWTARHGHAMVALSDGSLVLMGGSPYGTLHLNDVWRSTDAGATWTLQTAAAGWAPRQYLSAVALPDDSIVVMGGITVGDTTVPDIFYGDVWRSTDKGATWTLQTAAATWTRRHSAGAAVLPDGSIAVAGGVAWGLVYSPEVWTMPTAASSAQHPTHTYAAPGTYPVTLVADGVRAGASLRVDGAVIYGAETDGPAIRLSNVAPWVRDHAPVANDRDLADGGSAVQTMIGGVRTWSYRCLAESRAELLTLSARKGELHTLSVDGVLYPGVMLAPPFVEGVLRDGIHFYTVAFKQTGGSV